LEAEHGDKEKADYWEQALDGPGKIQQNLDYKRQAFVRAKKLTA
jgi:hypothetical protein